MTSEKIQEKTAELHARTRTTLLRGIAASLIVAGISGYGIQSNEGPLMQAVFTLAIVWSLAGQYFVNRGMWSDGTPGDAALTTGLESYRQEVERQRSLSARFLLWTFGPLAFAIGALIALLVSFGMRHREMPLQATLQHMAPFLSLLVIWIVSVFVIRTRNQRELQREIGDLKEIEKANR